MRNIILYAAVTLIAVGCASSETKKTDAQTKATDMKLGAEFTAPVAPQSIRTADNKRADCPRNIQSIKGKNWRQQVTAGSGCVHAGQWKMVELIGDEMSQSQHLVPWGPYFLSLAAEQRKEFPRALWMIELALKKAPASGLLTYQQGRIYWQTKDQNAALKSFQRATELDKRIADAQLILGQTALINGQVDEAIKRFDLCLEAESRAVPALLGLAEAKIKKNDSKGASEALSQAVFVQPTSYRARIRQAQVLETLEKKFPEALSAYKRIKTLDKEKKLDQMVDVDLDAKIREMEGAAQTPSTNQLSLREPQSKKVRK